MNDAARLGALILMHVIGFGFAWWGLKHSGWISPVCGVLWLACCILGWVAFASDGGKRDRLHKRH